MICSSTHNSAHVKQWSENTSPLADSSKRACEQANELMGQINPHFVKQVEPNRQVEQHDFLHLKPLKIAEL